MTSSKRITRFSRVLGTLAVLATPVTLPAQQPSSQSPVLTITLDQTVIDQSHAAIKVSSLEAGTFPTICTPDPHYALILVDSLKKQARICTGSLAQWTPVTGSFIKGIISAATFPYTIHYDQVQTIALTSPGKVATLPSLCWLGNCVKLRYSVADKNKIDKPAQFQFTEPLHGGANWAANIGLTIVAPDVLTKYFQLEYGPTVEYHRQTAPQSQQNSFLAGATATSIVGDIAESGNFASLLHLDTQYKDDREKSDRGFQATLDYNPVWTRYRAFMIGEVMDIGQFGGARGTGLLRALWQPTTGFDYDGIYKAKGNNPTGDVGRWYTNIELALYPFGGSAYLDDRLQLIGTFSNWYIMHGANGIAVSGDHVDLVTATLVYYIDTAKTFGASVQYVNGANPRLAQPEQKFWQVGLSLLLG